MCHTDESISDVESNIDDRPAVFRHVLSVGLTADEERSFEICVGDGGEGVGGHIFGAADELATSVVDKNVN